MTVVVALCTADGILFGADGVSVSGWDIHPHSERTAKVWTQGPFTFGHSGAVRWAQAVRYEWDAPTADGLTFGELVRTVPEAFRQLAEARGLWNRPAADKAPEAPSTMLMAYDGALYRVACDFTILRIEGDYWAVGGGEDCALGALYATAQQPRPAEYTAAEWARLRVTWALAAAETYKMGIRGPYTFVLAPAASATASAPNGAVHA